LKRKVDKMIGEIFKLQRDYSITNSEKHSN